MIYGPAKETGTQEKYALGQIATFAREQDLAHTYTVFFSGACVILEQ